jgi:predicted TIM-barrel fold metal-dependent hydrolase
MATTKSARIRERVGHPIIDSDGHTIEFEPALEDYVKRVGGSSLAERFRAGLGSGTGGSWYRASEEERRARRMLRPPFWALPARNTLDRATASLPRLLHERLPELGIDFTVLYPTLGLFAVGLPDDEIRQGVCRAWNEFHSELFAPYADRMTPAALIPMHTPEEAIAALDHAVGSLGMKVIMMAGHVVRPIEAGLRIAPEVGRLAHWIDSFGIDSAFDYDPVWRRCLELGVSPSFHSGGMGWGSRRSISNYMYNHIGHFAAAGEATCKALFFGGVTRRFPALRFAFLECGVGWASMLLADLLARFEKRGPHAIGNLDPARLDRAELARLFERYAEKAYEGKLGALGRVGGTREASPNDFARAGIEHEEEIRDLFVPRFFFGCEADDRMNSLGFDAKRNAFGAKLGAIFSSDIGHWDVPDMREVIEEAYELVEDGLLGEDDFRAFTFENPARLWTAGNPRFFQGTAVESAVARRAS